MNATKPGYAEPEIPLVPGTRDWADIEHQGIEYLQRDMLEHFSRAGYESIRTPILEFSDLHERKSGAGIVARLFELADDRAGAVCLRPELTASIVRAYLAMPDPPALPLRLCCAGTVFRKELPRACVLREFTQVGVELLGAGGPAADAEIIALAESTLRIPMLGRSDAVVRIGHLGLILEVLSGSGLPLGARAALVEILSEASEGHQVGALESALDRLVDWLKGNDEAAREILPSVHPGDDRGVDRLFRQLVPDVTGRRSGHEIIGRLRTKWELGHKLQDAIKHLRDHIHILGSLSGDAPEVLGQLRANYAAAAPQSLNELEELIRLLGVHGISDKRVRLEPGFSRGIGFYTQMVFALEVETPAGMLEVCGGGRYDGLARAFGGERDARGAGFAFGLERLASLIPRHVRDQLATVPRGHLIVPKGPQWADEAIRLANFLQSRGLTAVAQIDANPDAAVAIAQEQRRDFLVLVAGAFDAQGSLTIGTPAKPNAFVPVGLAQLAPDRPR